ncbi:hypothetical protein LMF32_02870 [Desemzia sp. C1]|uniref:hypothetical protein n=1 Tax=Desemzia sp. C1 TaxID=2892016 RepID=UPI001E335094|nr:hypothetical protein [Desemzia sp. C1]MCI3028072.1 hypothetical protein [Desemzia sp. C1]
MVVDHSSIIREVDVGAAFLSAFTKPIFVKEEGAGNYFPAPSSFNFSDFVHLLVQNLNV